MCTDRRSEDMNVSTLLVFSFSVSWGPLNLCTVSPTFRVSLPSSIKPFWEHPHSCAGFNFQMIPNPVKMTLKINCLRLQRAWLTVPTNFLACTACILIIRLTIWMYQREAIKFFLMQCNVYLRRVQGKTVCVEFSPVLCQSSPGSWSILVGGHCINAPVLVQCVTTFLC